jgi:antirestriction protein ArdC
MNEVNQNQKKVVDVYQLVTDRIIKQLEKGVIPWRKPWTDAGVPQNLISRRAYRGVNVMLLSSLDYEHNFFLTFKQAQELGATIIKGEKSHIVVFTKWEEKEDEETGEKKKIPFLRYYNVFNVAQCDGISADKVPVIEKPNNPIEACEEIVKSMPLCPNIRMKEAKAYYNVEKDFINMPKMKTFKDSDSFYGTLFHELIHSTGHEKRLNRKELVQKEEFGSEEYSKEELTAEIGACYLKAHAGIGIEDLSNNASYIDSWLNRLRNDKRFIVYASAQAQRAVDFILNVKLVEVQHE